MAQYAANFDCFLKDDGQRAGFRPQEMLGLILPSINMKLSNASQLLSQICQAGSYLPLDNGLYVVHDLIQFWGVADCSINRLHVLREANYGSRVLEVFAEDLIPANDMAFKYAAYHVEDEDVEGILSGVLPPSLLAMISFKFLRVQPSHALDVSVHQTLLCSRNGNEPQSISSGIFSLIPKGGDASTLRQWRPITLMSSVYKILARMISAQLRPFLPDLIHSSQIGFVQDRSIPDNVVTFYEVVESARQTDQPTVIMLLDFEKAYDRVDWQFLEGTLSRMGFPQPWIRGISALYRSATAAVTIGGHVERSFTLSPLVRQGCPLWHHTCFCSSQKRWLCTFEADCLEFRVCTCLLTSLLTLWSRSMWMTL
ncbi:hypothetical protein L7F22_006366 [Adiantum nelumboides]|nr:hypothetical protein [Adiantum nelumboides]